MSLLKLAQKPKKICKEYMNKKYANIKNAFASFEVTKIFLI